MWTVKIVRRKADTVQRRLRRWVYQRCQPCRPTVPVFVVGCQRSGTDMTLRAFDLSLDARVYWPGDLRAYRAQETDTLREPQVIRRILARSGAAATVFKPLHHLQRAREFLDTYPDLRIVWLLRNYQDCVNSCVRKWTTMKDTLAQVAADPSQAGWHGDGLTPRLLQLVRTHYHDGLSLESAFALFWYLRNSFYFELSLQSHRRVRIFRYEQLVQPASQEFRRMFQFCGCPFQPAVTREVFASSVQRHAPPVIDPRIDDLCGSLMDDFESLLGGGQPAGADEASVLTRCGPNSGGLA